MGFFSKLKSFGKKVASKVGGFIKNIPKHLQKAKESLPMIKQKLAQVASLIELFPSEAKGALQSAINKAESMADAAGEKIEAAMAKHQAASGNSDVAEE